MERRHKVLFEQLNTYRSELVEMVEEVSDEDSDIIPNGFNIISGGILATFLWINIYGYACSSRKKCLYL